MADNDCNGTGEEITFCNFEKEWLRNNENNQVKFDNFESECHKNGQDSDKVELQACIEEQHDADKGYKFQKEADLNPYSEEEKKE